MGSRATSSPARAESRRALIVEFTGAPGSGKSTLVSQAVARARERGMAVVERDEILRLYLESGAIARLVRACAPAASMERTRLRIHQRFEAPLLLRRFVRHYPRGWELFLVELERIRAEIPEEHARIDRWVRRGIRQFMMARARSARAELVLCDEGIAHRSVNLFANSQPQLDLARLRSFLGAWALPDVVVHVRASQQCCAQRAWSRGVPKRLEGSSEAQLLAFVTSSALVSAEIANEARRRGLPTFEINNEHPSVEDLLGSPECEALSNALLTCSRAAPRPAA